MTSPRLCAGHVSSERLGERSASVRARVERARELQRQRFDGTSLACNADMGPAEVRQFCTVDATGKALLRTAMQQLHISARAYHRIKLACTIADPSKESGRAWRGARGSSIDRGGGCETRQTMCCAFRRCVIL